MNESRLLILDDDALIGRTIQTIGESAGLQARFTSSHTAFFIELERWQPTHIALDLIMPDMDGMQVISRLAELGCTARIIITSGVGNRVLDAAGRSASEHGLSIAGVLCKPFSPGALRALLGAAAKGSVHKPSATTDGSAPRAEITAEELDTAIRESQLYVAYQPKVVCDGGELAGFEALVRWNHPERGFIAPDRFIPLAESSGLIDALTSYVLQRSMHWFSRNFLQHAAQDSAHAVTLSVNISAKTLADRDFVESCLQACESAGLAPARVIFELTETSAMEDPVASLDLLTRLRMKGFQLSIDDFGTGFSSMLQLARLPFSEIKVDKSFVINASSSQESRVVIKSIVDLGRSMGLRSTAEGVEDAATLEFLRHIGCDLAQGFHIGRPMDGNAALAWCEARN